MTRVAGARAGGASGTGVAAGATTGTRASERPSLQARTLCEAFQITAAADPGRVALRTLGGGVSITFAEYAERVRSLAGGLHALGVRRGDTVGLMLTNRPDFHLLDVAAMHLGATAFSIYNTSPAEQIAHVIGDAGNRVLIVEQAFLRQVQAALGKGDAVEHLVVLDGTPTGAISPAELEALDPGPGFDFDATWRAVGEEDVLTLIYTSGTTGAPKGVQLTHRNVMAEWRGLAAAASWLGEVEEGSIVSFLPLAHIADRGLNHYGQMIWGETMTTCPDATRVFEHVAEARPTRFGGVPRVWEKLMAALQARPSGAEPEQVRAALGFDRCQWYIIGAAPAPTALFEFFAGMGITLCEVWGMSELSCVATLVPRDAPRFGTVGLPLPGVELALDADGEVLVRGEIVMKGYRNLPERTAETIGPDGWLRTGDIGRLDADGYLSIVDRKKELIINAAGKNMSPANIEQQLKMGSELIGQACVIGDRRPYNVALIVLDPDACASFAGRLGLQDADLASMAAEPAVLEEVRAGIERANSHLSRVEQIKRFTVLECDWPPAGDELTPTMKLKRRPISQKYAALIDALYAGGA